MIVCDWCGTQKQHDFDCPHVVPQMPEESELCDVCAGAYCHRSWCPEGQRASSDGGAEDVLSRLRDLHGSLRELMQIMESDSRALSKRLKEGR